MQDFDQMEASLLYCPKCREATPVRKRLLIVLPEGDKFDYVCARCGTVSGDKIEREAPQHLGVPLAPRSPRSR
jgi:hypothetical protein